MFERIRDQTSNQISIAIKRLNYCLLRDDLEDAVVDTAIGLEVLLGDDDGQALSYKLQMRAAALATIDPAPERSPEEIRREVRGVYERRSRIVHGGTRRKQSGKDITAEPDNTRQERNEIVKPLRYVLGVLLRHPQFLDPKRIDAELLLAPKSRPS